MITEAKVKLEARISCMQYQWRNDPTINAWTRQNGLLSEEDMEKWRDKIANDPTIKMLGIMVSDIGKIGHGQFIDCGTAGLTSINLLHGNAEFSLLIDPKMQGRGYGRLALQELLKYGFKNYPLRLIFGETFEGNPAIKLFMKVGMIQEGFLRKRYFKNGQYINSLMVSILREEAEKQPWWV